MALRVYGTLIRRESQCGRMVLHHAAVARCNVVVVEALPCPVLNESQVLHQGII